VVLTASERRYVTDLYDGGVAYADQALGRLFDGLRGRGMLDSTIVVVLSDHGEELWDHGSDRCPDHGHSLYEELTHVPLLIRAPGLVSAGLRIARPVSLIDVAPTLLDLARLPADGSYAGVDLIASCRGAEPPIRPVFSESTSTGPDRYAVRLDNLKAIAAPRPGVVDSVSAPPLEVFDLAADRTEARPLPPDADHARLPVVAMAERRAGGTMHDPAETVASGVVPPDVSERLRALGYAH
jgi:arylsulfatase A-like enzyme